MPPLRIVNTLVQRFSLLASLILASVSGFAKRMDVVNPDSPEEMSAYIVQERGEYFVLPYSEILELQATLRTETGFEFTGYLFARFDESKNRKPVSMLIRDGAAKSVQKFEAEGRVFPFEQRYAGMIISADRSGGDAGCMMLFRNRFAPGGKLRLLDTFLVFRDYARMQEERLLMIGKKYKCSKRTVEHWDLRKEVLPDELVYCFRELQSARQLQARLGGTLEGNSVRVAKPLMTSRHEDELIERDSLLVVYPWRAGEPLPTFHDGCPLFYVGFASYRPGLFMARRNEKLVLVTCPP